MIDSLYSLLGLESVTSLQGSIVFVFCLVLLFFGSLCVFNALLTLITSIFNLER